MNARLLHLNRRAHLYLALFLVPWFVLYGVSSIVFNHGTYFEELDRAKNIPLWTKVAERTNYRMPVVPEGDNLKPFADFIVKDLGLPQGQHGAYRPGPGRIEVYVYTFWKSTQVKCFLDEKRLVVEDRRFRWDHFLSGLHANGGFESGGLYNLWSVLVDVVCLGMALWVLTGLVMWWTLPPTRKWGWFALVSGVVSFAVFLWGL
jgi:hypothetical protein